MARKADEGDENSVKYEPDKETQNAMTIGLVIAIKKPAKIDSPLLGALLYDNSISSLFNFKAMYPR